MEQQLFLLHLLLLLQHPNHHLQPLHQHRHLGQSLGHRQFRHDLPLTARAAHSSRAALRAANTAGKPLRMMTENRHRTRPRTHNANHHHFFTTDFTVVIFTTSSTKHIQQQKIIVRIQIESQMLSDRVFFQLQQLCNTRQVSTSFSRLDSLPPLLLLQTCRLILIFHFCKLFLFFSHLMHLTFYFSISNLSNPKFIICCFSLFFPQASSTPLHHHHHYHNHPQLHYCVILLILRPLASTSFKNHYCNNFLGVFESSKQVD